MAVQMIINQVGPLPITASFNSVGDSPMYLEVNGSVWTQTANQMIGIDIALDGQVIGTAKDFFEWIHDSPSRSPGIHTS